MMEDTRKENRKLEQNNYSRPLSSEKFQSSPSVTNDFHTISRLNKLSSVIDDVDFRNFDNCKSYSDKNKQTSTTELYSLECGADDVSMGIVDDFIQYSEADDLYESAFEVSVSAYIDQFCKEIFCFDETLFKLLSQFSECCNNFYKCRKELEEKYRDLSDLISDYWKFKGCQITAQGVCVDGFQAHKTIDFELAYKNECTKADELEEQISSFRSFLFIELSSEQHKCSISHFDVDIFIYQTLQPFLETLPNEDVIRCIFSRQLSNKFNRFEIEKLKRIVVTLFFFVRNYKNYNKQFNVCVKQWLYDVLSIFIRCAASAQDHIFLLNCFLRCPSGYLEWNDRFLIAFSTSDICQKAYLHYLVLLFGSFLPVFQTRPFLTARLETNPYDSWQLIGMHLEDEELINPSMLDENEFLKIFANYRIARFLKPIADSILSHSGSVTSQESIKSCLMLRSFCNFLVTLLCQIMKNYQHSCYNTVQKACGKSIRELIHSLVFIIAHIITSVELSSREIEDLKTISDLFLVQSLIKLFSSTKKPLWSIFCCIIYEKLYCDKSRWCILAKFMEVEFDDVVDDRLETSITCRLSDVTYLENLLTFRIMSEKMCFLTTLNRLAVNSADRKLVVAIATAIFKITFLSEKLCELFRLEGIRCLYTLANANTYVIGPLMNLFYDYVEYTYDFFFDFLRNLPMKSWVPDDDEFLGILNRFHISISTEQHFYVFREFIKSMNWDATEKISYHLPLSLHELMGLYLLKINCVIENVTILNESTLPSWIIGNKKSEILNWIWSIALRLNLHRSLHDFTHFFDIINGKSLNVPSLDTDKLKLLKISIYANLPLANYLVLQMTNVGHDSAVFFESGVKYFRNLVDWKYFDAASIAAVNLTPILITTYQYMNNDDSICVGLFQLLNADNSCSKCVSDYIYRFFFPSSSAPVLADRLLFLMASLETYHDYRLLALTTWISLILKWEKWKSSANTCFILDKLLTHSFIYDLGSSSITNLFFFARSAVKSSSRLSKVFEWFTFASTFHPFVDVNYPFLTFVSLSAYENQYKAQFDAAMDLLHTQCIHDPSMKTIANAWKATRKTLESSFSYHDLPIYFWCKAAKSLKPAIYLNILFWQKFFHYYVRANRAEPKLFSDPSDVTLLKQCKQALLDCLKYNKQKSDDVSEEEQKTKLSRICDVYRAFLLWLDEPRLHDAVIDLDNFPKEYECCLLRRIVDDENELWTEFVDLNELSDSLSFITSAATFNVEKPSPLTLCNNKSKPMQCLQNFFSNNCLDFIFPPIPNLWKELNELLFYFIDEKNCLSSLKANLDLVNSYVLDYTSKVNNYKSMDVKFLEYLSMLWRNETITQVFDVYCTSLYNPLHSCSGPAYVSVSYQSKVKNLTALKAMDNIRKTQRMIRKEILNCSSQEFSFCIIKMKAIVKYLKQLKENNNANNNDVGSHVFFMLYNHLSQISDYFEFYKDVVIALIHELGKIYVDTCPVSQGKLFHIILDDGKEWPVLLEHFNPSSICRNYPILMEKVRQHYICCDKDLIFSLLEKFDIENWIKTACTNERTVLLHTILNFLCQINDPYADTASNQVIQPLLAALEQIVSFRWPSLFGKALHFLLNACGSTSYIPSITWSTITNTISNNELILHSDFESFQLTNTINWMGYVFRSRRNILTNFKVYSYYVPYCSDIHKFLHLLVQAYIRRLFIKGDFQDKKAISEALHVIYDVYCPWIEPLVNENHVFLPFSESEHCYASLFLCGFVNVFSFGVRMLKQYENLKSWVAQELLYYLHKLFSTQINAEFYFNSWHSALESFDWSDIILENFGMENLVDLSKFNSPSVVQLALCLANKIQWSKQSFSIQYGDNFCHMILQLLIHLSTSRLMPVVEPTNELENLLFLIENHINWQFLSDSSFLQTIADLKRNVKWNFLFASKVSSDGYAMRALKCGCELKVHSSCTTASKYGQKKRIAFMRFVNSLLMGVTAQAESEIIIFIKNLLSEIETLLIFEYCSITEIEELISEIFQCAVCNDNGAAYVYVALYDWLDTFSPLIMPILRVVCRRNLDVPRKIMFIEACIMAYSKKSIDSQSQNERWTIVLSDVQLNLESNDLPFFCIANHCLMVLFAWFTLLSEQCGDDTQKSLAVLDRTMSVLETVHDLSRKEEEKLILIIWKVIRFVNSLTMKNLVKHESRLKSFIKCLIQWLLKMKESTSMKSSFFQFGKSENFSPIFNFFCLCMAAGISLTYLSKYNEDEIEASRIWNQCKDYKEKLDHAQYVSLITYVTENLYAQNNLDVAKIDNVLNYFIINAFPNSVLLKSIVS